MTLRCLLVDDDRVVIRAAQRHLAHRGHTVDIATSGASAREREGPYDCVVLDMDLGDESGLEIAREFVNTRTFCVVFFSASTCVDARLAASELGTFVSKEEGVHALARTVEAAVEETQQARLVVNGDTTASSRTASRVESGFRKKR